MTTTCAVVQDLLPLYVDDVCSPDSRRIVDEHLLSCQDCRRQLGDLRTEFRPVATGAEAGASVRALAGMVRRKRLLGFLVGATVVAFVAVLGCLVAYVATGSYVDADGLLHEPFYLLGLAWGFGLLGIVTGIAAAVVALRRRAR